MADRSTAGPSERVVLNSVHGKNWVLTLACGHKRIAPRPQWRAFCLECKPDGR